MYGFKLALTRCQSVNFGFRAMVEKSKLLKRFSLSKFSIKNFCYYFKKKKNARCMRTVNDIKLSKMYTPI